MTFLHLYPWISTGDIRLKPGRRIIKCTNALNLYGYYNELTILSLLQTCLLLKSIFQFDKTNDFLIVYKKLNKCINFEHLNSEKLVFFSALT